MQKVLVTGAAGFIASHVCRKLLARGDIVTGIDSVNSYYDPLLKEARLALIGKDARQGSWNFVRGDLADGKVVADLFAAHKFDRVIHLAAQAGVRHSITHPHDYVQANIVAFTNMLEACRHAQVPHLTYASTSSVYGASTALPFSENDGVGHPLQFYAATKRANELMAHSYSHLFGLPTTGLRFFTVYGPWGRPDMALFLFTKNMIEGKPIKLFNGGNHTRDFTYVEDIAEGVIRASDAVAAPDPSWNPAKADIATSNAPYRVYNIGNSTPVPLLAYIEAIEDALGVKAIKEYLPLQPGDVPDTCADVSRLEAATGYRPTTPVKTGVQAFVDWYRDYYRV
ncbi:NAD-dependent epimerase [Roseomonas sp. PWR1]|uniref:NAD-dependent epimerase n=1 Tax=Roseomonas nitratireducens TaxID=2820810 RepID=A0ABS4AMI5_9PROT|nr:NAD-dependent epimerase [Neoroseomonas nitratireducens]MBP0462574.1 NAD-dependent epimerase [Neoroseomonas nitratireducens]